MKKNTHGAVLRDVFTETSPTLAHWGTDQPLNFAIEKQQCSTTVTEYHHLPPPVANSLRCLTLNLTEKFRRPWAPYAVEDSTIEQMARRVYGARGELADAGRLVMAVAVVEADTVMDVNGIRRVVYRARPRDALTRVVIRAGEDDGACSICLADFRAGEAAVRSRCRHFFHEGCIARWLARRPECPICRTQIRQTNYTRHE